VSEDAKPSDRGPGVRFPPPSLFAVGFGAAWLVDTRVRSLPFIASDVGRVALEIGGIALAVAGIALALWGAVTFRGAGTAIYPNQPARHLVRDGPYRFTRNPMYVGMIAGYLGGSLMVNSIWPVVFLPFVIALLLRFVIRREEEYLEGAFGDEYRNYRRDVSRFIAL
jgi:protein-S-isoprenylcysteine O-methyltransferase Ste14